MVDIKPCPFCGGLADIRLVDKDNINGYYHKQFYIVICLGCYAQSGEVEIKFLADFTDYTVRDFKENPILRAEEQEKYDEYLETKKQQAAENWNRRVNE